MRGTRHILQTRWVSIEHRFSKTVPRSFSTQTENVFLGGFSKSNLGLESSFVRPVSASIRQLPEVEASIDKVPSSSTVDDLKRAAEVFSSFNKGGREHLAVQAMLAECQQRLAIYDEAIETLQELELSLQSSESANESTFQEDTTLALAKVYYTQGNFEKSQDLCETIVSTYDDLNESFPSTNLHLASAMTGKALSQLAAMKTMDDAYSVRDYFRVAVKFLERHPSSGNSLPQAVSLSNAGIAEAVYNIYLQESNDVSVPMTPALKFLFQGLQKTAVSQISSSQQILAASHAIEAGIQANLAWGVLNYEEDRSDRLTKASEYAKKALAFYDAEGIIGKEGLSWVLSVVACCYHEAGSAVIAEGLFQSAINKDGLPPDTLTMLQLRDAHKGYAKLCTQWDNREKDAMNLERDAGHIESSLHPNWQGKSSGIHGSLWFWTPGELHQR